MTTFSIHGFFYPFRGLTFLFRHPRLFSCIAIPLAFNALLYALFVWFTASRLEGWINYFLPAGDAWYWTVIFYLSAIVVGLLLILVVVYTFTIVGSILLSPFNDFLSEKVEFIHTGEGKDEPFRLMAVLRDSIRAIKSEIGRLLLYGGGFGILALLNLFPPIGTAAYAILLPPFTLFFIAWEFFDYSMERHKMTFGLKRKTSFKNGLTFIAFGAGAALLLMIPIVNLATIPVCVTGATLLFCDLKRAGRVAGNTKIEEKIN